MKMNRPPACNSRIAMALNKQSSLLGLREERMKEASEIYSTIWHEERLLCVYVARVDNVKNQLPNFKQLTPCA